MTPASSATESQNLFAMQQDKYDDKPGELVFLNPIGGVSLGGGEMVAMEVLESLAGRGWKITLLTPADSSLASHLITRQGIEVHPLGLEKPTLHSASVVVRIARRHRHAIWYGNTYRSLKWLALAKIAAGVRTICHLHESYYRQYYFARTRWLAPFVDRFICISDAVRREIVQAARNPGLPTVTIYNGLSGGSSAPKDPEETLRLRTELGLPLSTPLVCMAGRSDPWKGHEVFLRAAAKVKLVSPLVRFLIIGGTWNHICETAYEKQVKALRSELGLEEIVGTLPHSSRIRDYMRCADVMAVPSLSEGFGRVAVEAMMEQTPVVASRAGGLAEIIREGQDGLLVAPGDADQLAAAILQLLKDDDARARYVASARQRSEELFSQEAMTSQIESALAGLKAL